MYDLNIYFIQNTIFMLRELESLKPIRWLNQGWVSSKQVQNSTCLTINWNKLAYSKIHSIKLSCKIEYAKLHSTNL